MERARTPGVGVGAKTPADCFFPTLALSSSGSTGIISAGLVNKASTPKHDGKDRSARRVGAWRHFLPAGASVALSFFLSFR